jgi:hypothetical protein
MNKSDKMHLISLIQQMLELAKRNPGDEVSDYVEKMMPLIGIGLFEREKRDIIVRGSHRIISVIADKIKEDKGQINFDEGFLSKEELLRKAKRDLDNPATFKKVVSDLSSLEDLLFKPENQRKNG